MSFHNMFLELQKPWFAKTVMRKLNRYSDSGRRSLLENSWKSTASAVPPSHRFDHGPAGQRLLFAALDEG